MKLYTLDDLDGMIQASRGEILQALKDIGAIEIDGYWRMIDPALLDDVMNLILLSITHRGWDISKISRNECIKEGKDAFDSTIISHCLALHGTPR